MDEDLDSQPMLCIMNNLVIEYDIPSTTTTRANDLDDSMDWCPLNEKMSPIFYTLISHNCIWSL